MYLPNKFILIEGIDGAGKNLFVELLEKEIKKIYKRSKYRSLSIFGQPFYSLEKFNHVKSIIEYGKTSGDFNLDLNKLKQNRLKHEKYISSNFKGLKICVRGVLTDVGTLYCKYNKFPHSNIGQGIKIDLLIIIDSSILNSLKRIKKRRSKKQWRETYQYLSKFKAVYFNKKFIYQYLKPKKIIVVRNNKNLKYLEYYVKKIIKGYI